MKLSHLRDVLAVAECGSLRAAGRHLNIAQPAISRSILEIERELGVTLFERSAKGVRTTAVGETFLRRAKTIESEIRRATEEIEQLKGRGSGQVSVAMSSAPTIAILPAVMTAFRKRYPDALLKMSEGMFQVIEPELTDGRLDFYVGPIDPAITATHLNVEKLFEIERVVAARRGHPLARADTLASLVDAQWIRPARSTRSTEADFVSMFTTIGLEAPNIVMHSQSTLMSLLSLANSDLLTILPQPVAELPPTSDGLIRLHLKERLPPVTISIVRRYDIPLTPMAEYLCDMIRRASGHYVNRRALAAVG